MKDPFPYIFSSSKFFQIRKLYPAEDGEEGEEDGADDVRAGEAEHVVALAPRVAHVAEHDEEHEAPEPGEGHVEDHEVLPGLDRRHLFKEPETKNKNCVTYDSE